MRILMFAPNYLPATRYGGPIRSSHGLAKALVGLGHEVHVATTNVDGASVLDVPLREVVEIDGVQVRYFATAQPRRIYYAPEMGRIMEREIAGFDGVHINGVFLWPGPKIARLAHLNGVPHVVSPRGMLVPELIAGKSALAKRAWIRLVEQRSLRTACAIHVTSMQEAADIARLGLDLAPVRMIGNGVEGPERMPTAADIDDVWHGVPAGRRVAFLGRLDWTKGVDLAIDAVLAHGLAHLLVAGPDQIGLRGKLEPRLLAARSNDGQPCGRFIGEVEGARKWALLAGADIVLAPSIRESFGMTVAEALVIGTPVICTPGVGAAEIVRRIDPGCVVERREAGLLVAALEAVLADETRRRRFGSFSRVIMETHYSWAGVAQQFAAIFPAAQDAGGAGRKFAA